LINYTNKVILKHFQKREMKNPLRKECLWGDMFKREDQCFALNEAVRFEAFARGSVLAV
jgi:hypothetical protein